MSLMVVSPIMIFQFFSAHILEILATLTGLFNVYLAARANIWNWLFGMISVSLYLVIFLKVKLYADMSLQLIFFILQFYGLYQWLYGGVEHSSLLIRKASRGVLLAAVIITFCLFFGIAFILQHYTDSTTIYTDAFITALSLVAQWMMSKKWIEHWWLWIIVDLISIEMYFNKNLYFTSGLYVVFCMLGLFGYYCWKKDLVSHYSK